MPRRKVQFYPGGLYHVVNRAAFKHNIFNESKYNHEFVRLLIHYCKEYDISIIAYCLMPTHFHLLLRQDGEHSVSVFLKCVTHEFAVFYNQHEQKSGAVFQGRFRCKYVANDPYLYTATSYIHLNPVAAGLCSHPSAWQYCNYESFVGTTTDKVTNMNAVYDLFGDRTAYKILLHENLKKL